MRINLRELRYTLRCTKRSGPQPGVILRCRKVPQQDRATLTLEDTVSPGEATFLSEPEEDTSEALDRRARLNRTKLEQIAERWEETSAELTMTESILRIAKTTGRSRLEIAVELESAGPPLCRELKHADTPPVTSTDTKTIGDVLERLESCAPPGAGSPASRERGTLPTRSGSRHSTTGGWSPDRRRERRRQTRSR